jgi:predicted ATPase
MISIPKDRRIMFTGPHGIGKTCTAKQLAKDNGLWFYPSIAAEVAVDLRYDMNAKPSIHDIAIYQETLMDRLHSFYKNLSPAFGGVFDRSPLDVAAYAFLQLQDAPEYEKYLENLVIEAMKFTRGYCDVIVFPRANLDAPYEAKDKRPASTPEQIKFRKDYAESVEAILCTLTGVVPYIIVPMEYQFDARQAYIQIEIEKLAW